MVKGHMDQIRKNIRSTQPVRTTATTIEITNDVSLIKEGSIVGVSEAALLALLNILPFSYGLQLQHVR